MITTDQLQEGLDKLRDALEAFAFTFNSVVVVVQKGHVILPTAEVTGEYLASLPVGLDTYERERVAVRPDDAFTTRREITRDDHIPVRQLARIRDGLRVNRHGDDTPGGGLHGPLNESGHDNAPMVESASRSASCSAHAVS